MSIQGSPASRPAVARSLGFALLAAGCFVAVNAQAASTTEQVMVSFTGTAGSAPQAPLVKLGTVYYGTTSSGGKNGHGTVFRMTGTGVLKTLHSFNGTDGSGPGPIMLGNDGALYGMTGGGGAFNYGTVFRITTAGVFSDLHDFDAGADGAFPSPRAALVETADGMFYGTTLAGGSACTQGTGCGTIFSMTPDGTVVTTLHAFFGGFDSQAPYAGLAVGADGNFYGTTNGQSGTGIIFQMKPDGTMTTLTSIGGYAETPLLLAKDGNFYGTTLVGGTGDGSLYSMTPAGAVTTLYQFSGGVDGSTPAGRLLQGTDGAFYGTTQDGGASGCGTAFRFTTSTGLKTLYSFTCAPDASGPVAGLTQVASNIFLGTSAAGGTADSGAVYKLTVPKR